MSGSPLPAAAASEGNYRLTPAEVAARIQTLAAELAEATHSITRDGAEASGLLLPLAERLSALGDAQADAWAGIEGEIDLDHRGRLIERFERPA